MEGVSAGVMVEALRLSGPWGAVILVVWLNMRWSDRQHAEDRRRADAQRDEMRRWMQEVLTAYKRDVDAVSQMYRDNVALVKQTQEIAQRAVKTTDELAEIVHLNTQVQTRLVDQIANNLFCPMTRAKGLG